VIAWLRRVVRAERVLSHTPEIPLESPRWTDEDRQRFREFLASETGQRLGAVLRGTLARKSIVATSMSPEKLPGECGRVAGLQDAIALLDQLSFVDEVAVPRDDRPADDLGWLNSI